MSLSFVFVELCICDKESVAETNKNVYIQKKENGTKRSRECPIRKKIGCDKIFRMSDHQMEHIGDAINAVTVANTATHVHQKTSRCIFDLVIFCSPKLRFISGNFFALLVMNLTQNQY